MLTYSLLIENNQYIETLLIIKLKQKQDYLDS